MFKNGIMRKLVQNNGYAKPSTDFVIQGSIMAEIFKNKCDQILSDNKRKNAISENELNKFKKLAEPKITLTGNNVAETKQLTKALFPNDPTPEIKVGSFDGVKTKNKEKAGVQ